MGSAVAPALAPIGEHSPSGSDTDFVFYKATAEGMLVHWSPCSPIRWAVDFRGMRGTRLNAVEQEQMMSSAFEEISHASGYTFERVDAPEGAGQPIGAGGRIRPLHGQGVDIVISYLSGTQNTDGYYNPLLEGSIVGLGGPSLIVGMDDGRQLILDASVSLDREDLARYSPTRQSQVIHHEIGHALGLTHVDAAQNMRATIDGMHPYYEAGDLAGFKALAAAGCYQDGAPPQT